MIDETRPPRRGLRLALAGAALALVTASTPVRAQTGTEPYNDLIPDHYYNSVVQYAQYGSSASGWQLTPTGDIDWFVIVCSQTDLGAAPRFLNKVRIDFTHSAGDLDVEVYTPHQHLIGASYGVGNQEELTIPGNLTSVYLKVFGYNGATNTYNTSFECR